MSILSHSNDSVRYRRDVGDILINASVFRNNFGRFQTDLYNPSYYVIRDDMIIYFVNDIIERLSSLSSEQVHGWEVNNVPPL